ncbi:hypothetical protein MKK70_03955 [Methylobacterium sp. E-041]|jgi:hypothetical protein|uniref:hypothetical protein n=1 Tax=unclassified Methylobacterium TaxID=2615210 RepID=UPI0011CA52FF|nr:MULTISPECIES: hypothetical protein [unclassified Methylobacterium]MCJ2042381.1 hypothetical protein [Methylobacterium sp. J-059]MCJ2076624.1 hypothetical protein [Methylobacterium sp. E-016]MCJ2104546.1 hypothetical protein [Methylobacterium sp. E-041]TXM90074.1 hypothetical protein FV223_19685 [Methylobacterium sp. WL116]TXN34503.1 hypothetical protein FV225_16405 [Methylobacterium sp. WL93]
MLTGPFQRLPGSSEGWQSLAHEPWLLPISDAASEQASDVGIAVRRAARPLWIAANGLCFALALLLAAETSTGWMSGNRVAATPKTVVTASAS